MLESGDSNPNEDSKVATSEQGNKISLLQSSSRLTPIEETSSNVTDADSVQNSANDPYYDILKKGCGNFKIHLSPLTIFCSQTAKTPPLFSATSTHKSLQKLVSYSVKSGSMV